MEVVVQLRRYLLPAPRPQGLSWNEQKGSEPQCDIIESEFVA